MHIQMLIMLQSNESPAKATVPCDPSVLLCRQHTPFAKMVTTNRKFVGQSPTARLNGRTRRLHCQDEGNEHSPIL
jgi:hypothetical protein